MPTERLRRSLLYVPGNMPALLQNIPAFQCDVCIIDLEDAVPRTEKDAARLLTRRFLDSYQHRNKEIFVRINGLDTPYYHDDLAMVLPALPDGIRLPKCESPELVEQLDHLLIDFEEEIGCEPECFKIIASVESARGIQNVSRTAQASPRLVALAFSAEDYAVSLQIDRPKTGEHLLVPRQLLLMACRAVGIQAIDTVWADTMDMDGFRRECELIKVLGFDGPEGPIVRNCTVRPRISDLKSSQDCLCLTVLRAWLAMAGFIACNHGMQMELPGLSAAVLPHWTQ